MVPPSSRELCADSPAMQAPACVKPELSTICLARTRRKGDSGSVVAGYGTKLKWIRSACGMTQEAFAAAVGIASRTLSIYENETNLPSKSNLKLIARYVGVPTEELDCFLRGNARLETLPRQMKRWVKMPRAPRITSKTTLGELNQLAGGT